MVYVAKQLEKAGVDMLHVSGGMTIKRGSSIPAAGTKLAAHAQKDLNSLMAVRKEFLKTM